MNTQKKATVPKKDAIVHAEYKLPTSLIATMEDLHIFSAAVYKSNMWGGIKNPETAMVRIQAGRELGLQPIMALNKIHVLPAGDIIIATAVLGAVAMDQGVRWQILQKDTKGCRLRIYMLDGSIPEHTESFMMEDAVRADLEWKDNYKKYPEEMFFNRCLSKGLRVFDPRIGAGFYTKEEMEDVQKFGKPPPQEREHREEEGIQDAEIVEDEVEEENFEEAVDEAMDAPTSPPPKTPAKSSPQKEEDIMQIKKHLEILQLDVKDFKLHLSEVQKSKKFVGVNEFGHLSLHEGDDEAIAFLRANAQEFSRRYIDRRMATMKPGERIGCFVVPQAQADA